jgi:hypothetical protein
MHLGAPIVAGTHEADQPNDVAALTRRVDLGLRAVTLNFRSADEARRVLSVSTVLAEVLDEFRPLHTPDPPLREQVRVAHRIAAIVPRLSELSPEVEPRVERFVDRLETFERLTGLNGIAASDVRMSSGAAAGAWFVVREAFIAAVAGPFALWGRVNHWLPLRIARSLALSMSRTPDEPAMNTIVAGLVAVLTFYIAQIAMVVWLLGWIAAVLYAVSLPLSATWDFRYADRLRRAAARVRTYLRFRRDPGFHQRLRDDVAWLRREAIAIDASIPAVTQPASVTA